MNLSKIFSIKSVSIVILLLISLVLTSCSGDSGNSNEVNSSGTPVEITHPAVMNLTDYLKLNANTIFLNKEIVRASFQGYIEKIYKNIGDEVNPGDVLFQVKTKESAAADSMRISIGNKIFAGAVLIKAKTKGVLTKLNYHNGDLISDGEQIAVVSNPSSLRIRLNVPFEDAQKIKLRQNCEINLPGGEKFNGIIDKSVPSVDPVSQTQVFLIKLLKYRELPENLNVFVMIPFRTFKNAIVLPKSSVMTNVTEDAYWIMKLANDTTAIRIDVNRGIETDSLLQILSPKLNLSDKVISSGAYGLPDTAKVEIIK
jgi:multidrug efflux pump subunit AcrA (membrane-fusion protein)